VSAHDPITIVSVAGLLLAGVVACLVLARHATQVDPTVAFLASRVALTRILEFWRAAKTHPEKDLYLSPPHFFASDLT
jgi:hypothetical protein